MDGMTLLVLLPMFTFLAVLVFALWQKERADRRMRDDNYEGSTLAVDTPSSR